MYKNILLPIDIAHKGSWKKSLDMAVEHAKASNAKLYVMTVIPDSGMAIVSQYFSKNAINNIIEEANKSLLEFTDENIPEEIEVQNIVTAGNVYESIISAAQKLDIDLIIMSAHRPELKDYLLGPNAARVVRHSDKSVLVVRD